MIRQSNIDPSSKTRAETNKQYYGNYLGIVVQNNDPEKRGRVKIYIPHITPAVYEKWDGNIDKEADRSFRFIGENIESDLTGITDTLKEILPWAECAAPLAGGSASGRYNARLKSGSISDSARLETTLTSLSSVYEITWASGKKETVTEEQLGNLNLQHSGATVTEVSLSQSSSDINSKYKLNIDGIGEKPARMFEVKGQYLGDAFGDSRVSNDGNIQTGVPNKVNKFTKHYSPTSYSNNAKGSFSVPNVGAHIWVFFESGDCMKPVYFAISFGTEDWKGIYNISDDDHGIDYPGTYENKSEKDDPTYNHNTETYRNKFTINQKGGTLEFVNTDNREILKMTHYSGSYKEFNNYTTTELAVNNDQKLVLMDQFLTVRGTRNEYVNGDFDLTVRGDLYRKVGTFNKQKYQEWQEAVRLLADIKQLFETKRTSYTETPLAFQKQSPIQGKNGKHDKCPVCSHGDRSKHWKSNDIGTLTILTPSIWSGGTGVYDGHIGERPSFSGTHLIVPTGNANLWTYEVPAGGFANFLGGGKCPVCGGTGLSPSTQNGTFADEEKDEQVKLLVERDIAKLALIEKEMGLGGSEIVHISKHKVETIGLVMNDFPSIRIDEVGKINNNEVLIFPDGVVTGMKESPLIEYVHVDDMPGGTYTLTACNRFNIQTGAGGLNFKSYGAVDIGGTIMNLVGEQVNVVTENEINIVADKRINIVSDILTLRQKNYGQVLVDSNLGVSQNVIIGGGMHVEGELTCHHITAPLEIQETELTKVFAKLLKKLKFKCNITGGNAGSHASASGGTDRDCNNWTGATVTLIADSNDDYVRCYDHTHQFKNLPLHLMKNSDHVRKVAKNCEKTEKIQSNPAENEHKGDGRHAKGEKL